MFMLTLPIIAKVGHNPNVYQLKNKQMWYIYTIKNYLAIKVNYVLMHAITQMNLKTY